MAGEQQLTQWEPGIDLVNRYAKLLRKGRDWMNFHVAPHAGDVAFMGSPELVQGIAPTMNKFAGYLQQGTDFLNKAKVPEGVPLVGGAGVGDRTLGGAAKGLEHLSYGGSPLQGKGQTLKLRDDVFDLAGVIPTAAGAAKVAPKLAKGYGKLAAEAIQRSNLPQRLGHQLPLDTWHGSTKKFDMFDPRKIGSGEGIQMQMKGTYLAGPKDTGDFYRERIPLLHLGRLTDTLSSSGFPDNEIFKVLMRDPNIPGDQKRVLHAIINDPNLRGMGIDDAVKIVYSTGNNKMFGSDLQKALSEVGHLYKVDLPDKLIPNMLSLDRPLDTQYPTLLRLRAGAKSNSDLEMAFDLAGPNPEKLTGAEFLHGVTGDDPLTIGRRSSKLVDEMSEAGIPGTKFLDQFHWDKGYGPDNYSVFPGYTDHLTILERNGVPSDALRAWAERNK